MPSSRTLGPYTIQRTPPFCEQEGGRVLHAFVWRHGWRDRHGKFDRGRNVVGPHARRNPERLPQ